MKAQRPVQPCTANAMPAARGAARMRVVQLSCCGRPAVVPRSSMPGARITPTQHWLPAARARAAARLRSVQCLPFPPPCCPAPPNAPRFSAYPPLHQHPHPRRQRRRQSALMAAKILYTNTNDDRKPTVPIAVKSASRQMDM